MNKSAFSLAAALIAMPVLTPAIAADCMHITLPPDPIVIQRAAVSQFPMIVGKETITVDATKKNVCYTLKGDEILPTKIEPASFCMSAESKKAKDQKVTVTFASGYKVDVSAGYTAAEIQKTYISVKGQCDYDKKNASHPAAPPSAIPDPTLPAGSTRLSYRPQQQDKGLGL